MNYREPANKMFYIGTILLTFGAISTFTQPRSRDINIFLLSIGGACTGTAAFVYLGDEVMKLLAEEYDERARNRRSRAVLRRVHQNRARKLRSKR